jgi:hypothetical protein
MENEVNQKRKLFFSDIESIINDFVQSKVYKKSQSLKECQWCEYQEICRPNEQIKEQFNPDGIQNELDPSYHVGAISDFYNAYEVAKENNKAHYFSADYMPSLRKATEFVMDLVYPNYSVENFNDTRSGRMQKSMLIKNLVPDA